MEAEERVLACWGSCFLSRLVIPEFVTFLLSTTDTASTLYHLRQIRRLDKIDELTREVRYSTAVSTRHGEECRAAIEVTGGEMGEDHKGTPA